MITKTIHEERHLFCRACRSRRTTSRLGRMSQGVRQHKLYVIVRRLRYPRTCTNFMQRMIYICRRKKDNESFTIGIPRMIYSRCDGHVGHITRQWAYCQEPQQALHWIQKFKYQDRSRNRHQILHILRNAKLSCSYCNTVEQGLMRLL